MVFDVMKLSFELRGGNNQRRGQIFLQVPNFSGVVQTVFNLREESIASLTVGSISTIFACRRFNNVNRLLPSASCPWLLPCWGLLPTAHCPLPTAFRCPRRREQHLLVEVGCRIAGDSDVRDVCDLNTRSAETIAHRFGWKSGAVLDAVESLFFNGRQQLAVFYDRC